MHYLFKKNISVEIGCLFYQPWFSTFVTNSTNAKRKKQLSNYKTDQFEIKLTCKPKKNKK